MSSPHNLDTYYPPFANCSLSSSLSSESVDVDVMSGLSTGAILKQYLSTFPSELKIAHFNARSMRSDDKFSELLDIVSGVGLDIICITESWLNDSISDSDISILGYRVIRKDRVHGVGHGGIVIYLNNSFSYKVLASSSPSQTPSVEYLIVEIVSASSKLLLAAVYHPPRAVRAGSLDQFEEELEFFLTNYQYRFVLGDFNIDLSIASPLSAQLRNLFISLNLHILPTDTTFHRLNYDSTLDLMAVGDESSVLFTIAIFTYRVVFFFDQLFSKS
uniref:Endonuclease/exonuclease/phosphatase domain-containing protein n=1 Tax=Cacopsylla melanoneura TaxID=428564 RepID=A0A8D9AX67_9HEMI